MIVEPAGPRDRSPKDFRADFDGEPRLCATLTLRFRGVDLEGVFWRPRAVGTVLEGVFPVTAAFVGVV